MYTHQSQFRRKKLIETAHSQREWKFQFASKSSRKCIERKQLYNTDSWLNLSSLAFDASIKRRRREALGAVE